MPFVRRDFMRPVRRAVAGFLAITAFQTFSAAAFAADLVITTGGSTGTYIEFGRNIKDVALKAGVDIEVVESFGSVHNLERLLGYEGADEGKFYQLAIVQEDVLADLRNAAEGNQTLERIVDKIQVVLPLYDEEVHIYVRDGEGISDLTDLNDLVIGAGKPGSGTYMTARFLHRLSGLKWQEDLYEQHGGDDGLALLKDFKMDAMFHVVGAPSKMGKENVVPEDSLTLAAITDPVIFETPGSPYRPAVLDSKVYPWLTKPVQTAAVGSVLVAYAYKGENCELIERVTRAILENLTELKRNGHPKWKNVDPAAAASRDLYECARRAFE